MMGTGGPLLLVLGIGYLIGSVPFGLLLTKAAGLGDIRSIGSGNIGATNVLRTGNKGLAAVTLLFDVLKGATAVFAAWFIIPPTTSSSLFELQMAAAAGGLGAFLGHIYPVWLGFKGGKGVATYIGVLLGLAGKLALVFCAVWLVVAFASRYSSLSALIAAVVVPPAAYLFGSPLLAAATFLMSALLIYKHEANIRRLLAGEESRIGG